VYAGVVDVEKVDWPKAVATIILLTVTTITIVDLLFARRRR